MTDKEFLEHWQRLGPEGQERMRAFIRLKKAGVLEHNPATGEFAADANLVSTEQEQADFSLIFPDMADYIRRNLGPHKD